jgi:hypothetical protein
MAKIIIRILKGICFLFAVLWLGLVGVIQYTCSAFPSVVGHQCHGSAYADIWFLPIFFSPIGIPAVVASIIIIIVATVRRKRLKRKI